LNFPIPAELAGIFDSSPALGRSFLVGGCVRDTLLGREVTDYDVECFGVSYEDLVRDLQRHGRVDLVGRSFGVAKLNTRAGNSYDFAVPRRDSKTGIGHRGFDVEFDAGISPEEAAARRDFTINAMFYDPRERRLLDFFGGRDDLSARILRHTGPAFVEDPLRVLRGMQFAGRFELTADPATLDLCRSIRHTHDELPFERVRDEWLKWASASVRPSLGLVFLEKTGWMENYPALVALRDTEQDPVWHPEGDVLAHTCHCLDALVELPVWQGSDRETRIVLTLAVLTHDIGKPAVTRREARNGRECVISPGHDEAGVALTEEFLRRMGAPNVYLRRVPPLVRCHMAHLQEPSQRAVRRLANRLQPATIDELCAVMQADHYGRPPLPKETPPAVIAIRAVAGELELQSRAPKPLLQGRNLRAAGLKPGPRFGKLLKAAFEAQLEGEFTDLAGAQRWLRGQLSEG
jgi:tRNA nucleotidyltransferase (CCA-adding enzyme)